MNYRNNTSFLMKYKPEDFFTLNEIDLSGSQGHVISDAEINEINKYSNRLLYLYMLNVSQNSIMKLFLFNFVNLKVIDASKNIITESSLSLPKLMNLNLSRNMLSNFPDLSKLPNLKILNVSWNNIPKITIQYIEPVRKTLNNLDFSYNHIEFTTIEFISFVEGLKIYDINSIGIEGNSFLKKNPRLQHNYRTFMYATLDNLFILDEEKRPIDNENLNPNEIRAQMLIEDKEINKTMDLLINDPLRTFSAQENQKLNDLVNYSIHHFLKNITCIQNKAAQFVNLVSLDLSNNMIEKVYLHDFVSLQWVNFNFNFITEATIENCPELTTINLGNNKLFAFPKFININEVTFLNLDNNRLESVTFESILSSNESLCIIYLRGNPLLQIQDLEIFYMFSKVVRIFLNDEVKIPFLSYLKKYPDDFNQELMVNGVHIQEEFDKIDEELELESESNEIKRNDFYHKKNIKEVLLDLNKLLTTINKLNGDNQTLYIHFLKRTNELISNRAQYTYDPSEIEEIKSIFKNFLMLCNELINLNNDYFLTMITIIIQFVIINDKIFCYEVCNYLKTLSTTEKKKDLQEAIQLIMDYPQYNLEVLQNLIGLMDDNDSLIEKVQRKLIFKMIRKIIRIDFTKLEIDKNLNITVELIKKYFLNQGKIFAREKLEGKRFTVSDFQRGFMGKMNKIVKKSTALNINYCFNPMNQAKLLNYKLSQYYSHNFIPKKQKEKFLFDGYNSGELSDDIEPSKIPPIELLTRQYGINIKVFEEKKITKSKHDSILVNFGLSSLIKTKKSSKISNSRCIKNASFLKNFLCSGEEGNKLEKPNFFKNELLKRIAEEDSILKFEKMKNEYNEFRDLIFSYIFLNTFQFCVQVLLKMDGLMVKELSNYLRQIDDDYFKDTLTKKANKIYSVIPEFYLLNMELFSILCKTYKKCNFPYKNNLMKLDFTELTEKLEDFINGLLSAKKKKVNSSSTVPLYLEQGRSNRFIKHLLTVYGCILMEENTSNMHTLLNSDSLLRIFELMKYEDIDPYVLLGCCDVMVKLFSNEFIQKDSRIFAQLISNVDSFKNVLHFLDPSHKQFIILYDKVTFGNATDDDELKQNPYDFSLITNPLMKEIFLKILSIFVGLSKFSPKQNNIFKGAQDVLNELRKYKLNELILKCLDIPDDNIRIKAMKCFYYFDHSTITNENMLQILETISKFSSVTEGKKEIILAEIYAALTSKLFQITRTSLNSNLPIQRAVKSAFTFLKECTKQDFYAYEDLVEKNILNISLLLFLITASNTPQFYEIVVNEISENNHSAFTEILYNDFKYYDENLYCPIEIERTFLGNSFPILFETLSSKSYCVPPYTYPFLRILIKAADIICNVPDYSMEANYNGSIANLVNSLSKYEINARKDYKIKNEMKKWHEIKLHFKNYNEVDEVLNIIPWFHRMEDKIPFKFPNKGMTQASIYFYKFQLIIIKYLQSTCYIENPDDGSNQNNTEGKDKNKIFKRFCLRKLTLNELITEHYNFIALFPLLMFHIFGSSSKLKDETIEKHLLEKFDHNLVNSHNILDAYEFFERVSQINTVFGSVKHFNVEIPYSTPYSKFTYNKIKKSDIILDNGNKTSLRVDLDNAMKISSLYSLQKMHKIKQYNPPNKFQYDFVKYSLNGLSSNAKRLKKEESVDNPHLRSLIIASFLRCCYGLMISPSKEIQKELIQYLFIDNKIKDILLFVDTSLYEYNNMNKIVMLLNKIFTVDNLNLILSSLQFKVKEDRSKENKAKSPVQFLNKFFMRQPHNATNDKFNDKVVFHSLYVISLFMEKLIFNYFNYYYKKKEANDFLFSISLFEFLSSFFSILTQIKIISIHPIFLEQTVFRKICSKELVSLTIDMIYEYDNYIAYSFYNCEFLNDLFAKIKGEGKYKEEIERNILQQIEDILNYIYTINKYRYKYLRFIAQIGNYYPEIIDKVTEKLCKIEDKFEDSQEFSILDDKLSTIFKMQKINMISTKLKFGGTDLIKENEYIIFYDFTDCEILKPESNEYYNNIFIVLTTNKLILFKYINEVQNIDKKNPLIVLEINDIIQLSRHDYANKIYIIDKNVNTFSLFFKNCYISRYLIEKIYSMNTNILFKENTILLSYINQKEDTFKNAISGKLKRIFYPSISTEKQKRSYNKIQSVLAGIKEIINQKINITDNLEKNFYKNLYYPTVPSFFFIVKVNGNIRTLAVGQYGIYVIKEKENCITSMKRSLEGYEYEKSDYFELDVEIIVNNIINILDTSSNREIIIEYYGKGMGKAILKIEFFTGDDMKRCRVFLMGVNIIYFERKDNEKTFRIAQEQEDMNLEQCEYDDIFEFQDYEEGS